MTTSILFIQTQMETLNKMSPELKQLNKFKNNVNIIYITN